MAREDGHSNTGVEHRGVERTSHANAGPTSQIGISGPLLTTAALIGVAALIQPELLAGMAIGAGVALTSSWLPNIIGGTVRPIVKSTVKAGYAAASMARELAAETSESMQDILAEARLEQKSDD